MLGVFALSLHTPCSNLLVGYRNQTLLPPCLWRSHRPGVYAWVDETGTEHEVTQGVGGVTKVSKGIR